jgi:hypothetical protein
MNVREALRRTLALEPVQPPRFESEFAPETVEAWQAAGHVDDRGPEASPGLDLREDLGVTWRRTRAEKCVVRDDATLDQHRRAYDPADPARWPADWASSVPAWRGRDSVLTCTPWNEGFFQIIGIADGRSLNTALTLLCEEPAWIDAAMDTYAGYLEDLIPRVLADVEVDYAVFREPIASNHGLIVSPATYARFAAPALKRVVDCLERQGVRHRVMWSAGAVQDLVPVWIDAGITGLYVNQAGQAGVRYGALRREFGTGLRLFGGVDWRAVVKGPAWTESVLELDVRPLLEEGGYIPYLDDTIRTYMPWDHFRYYRDSLDALIDGVFE